MPGHCIQRGENVSLRTLEREDVPFFQRAFTDPDIRYPLGNVKHMNREQVEERFEDESTVQFLVCLDDYPEADGRSDTAEDRKIGVISVTGADWHRPDLAYWLIPEVHGNGYGKEAVSLVIDYLFRVYNTPAVGADAYDFNEVSRGLLESLGFTQEGRKRKFRFVDEEYRDLIQYGLLRHEWEERTVET